MDGLHADTTVIGFDAEKARSDFPELSMTVHGKRLTYLDNAATTQKPRAVIDAICKYYETSNANVHRGVHHLSEKATEAYESSRATAAGFLNAAKPSEIIFVRGATEGINLVAHAYVEPRLAAGDEILVTELEHHSNIVPWQLAAERRGSRVVAAPVTEDGEVDVDQFRSMLTEKTKLAAFTHVSNAIGTVTPVKELTAICHSKGVPVLIDGAQAAPHISIDVQDIGADFYVVSGHKMYAPMGIGILYGKQDLLEDMGPYQGGGEMIERVSFEKSTYNRVPHRFEAGTPNVGGAVGLSAAIQYLHDHGIGQIGRHESSLVDETVRALNDIDRVTVVGSPSLRAGVVSFVIDGIHPHDAGTVLDADGIAVRTGHHCAQPLMNRYGVIATTRASFGLYNTKEDASRFLDGVKSVLEMFA